MTPSNGFSTAERMLEGKMSEDRKTSSKATREGFVGDLSWGAGTVVAEGQGGIITS